MKQFLSLAIVAALSCVAFAALDSPAGHPPKAETVAPDKPIGYTPPIVLEAPQFHYASAYVLRPFDSEPAFVPTVCPAALDVRHWNIPVIAKRETPFIARPAAVARSSI